MTRFLKSGNPDGEASPAAEPAATARGAQDAASEAAPAKDARRPAKDKPQAAPPPPEPDDDADPGEAEPRPARRSRAGPTRRNGPSGRNWVERASRAEAERDALAKQLEEAKKGPPPQSTPPPPIAEPIDLARDPEGYTRRVQGVVLNERLKYTSEMMASSTSTARKSSTDKETAYFQQRTQSDPRLMGLNSTVNLIPTNG